MYKVSIATRTSIKHNKGYEGETMEAKMRRIKNNKDPITESTPMIYTDRADGVIPEYDIRTDKFEVLIEAGEKAYEQQVANRKAFEEKLAAENKAQKEGENGPKTSGAQGEGPTTN